MCDRQLFDPRLTVRATDEGQRWNVVHCSTNLVVGMGQSLERGTRHILIPQLGRLPGVKYRDVPVVVAAVSIKDRVPVGVYWHPVTNGDSAPHAWAVGFPCMGHPVKKKCSEQTTGCPISPNSDRSVTVVCSIHHRSTRSNWCHEPAGSWRVPWTRRMYYFVSTILPGQPCTPALQPESAATIDAGSKE